MASKIILLFSISAIFLYYCMEGVQGTTVAAAASGAEDQESLINLMIRLQQMVKKGQGDESDKFPPQNSGQRSNQETTLARQEEVHAQTTGDAAPHGLNTAPIAAKEKRNPEVELLKAFRSMSRKQRLRNVADGLLRAMVLGKPWAAGY